MHGTFVSLDRMSDEDYELIAGWAASVTGSYSSSSREFFSGAQLKEMSQQNGMTYLMVVDPEGNRVGAVSYQQVTYAGSYSIGIAIGHPDKWAHGYGVEAALLLWVHLFHSRNAHRIEVVTGAFNLPMIQAITKSALTLEGVMRDYYYLDGEYHDAVMCSILRDDFYAAAASGEWGRPEDAVPAADKAQARRLLQDHVAGLGAGHVAGLLRDDDGRRPRPVAAARAGRD